jgi:hypothetical protein
VAAEAGLCVDRISRHEHLTHEEVLASYPVSCGHGDEEGLAGLIQPTLQARQLLNLAIGRRHSPDAVDLTRCNVSAVADMPVSPPVKRRRTQHKQGLFTLLCGENRPHHDAFKAMAGCVLPAE